MLCCCALNEADSAQIIDVGTTLEEKLPEKALEPGWPQARAGRPNFEPVPALLAAQKEESDVCFVARLSRQHAEEPLGLKMDCADERTIHVCRVRAEGGNATSRYNASVAENKKIKVGDYFTAVNGVSAEMVPADRRVSEALREQLLTASSFEVTVRRAEVFDCKIEKNGRPMGVELSYSTNCVGLIIVKISDGAVKISAPEVQPCDRILAVGAVEGPPESLLDAIRDAGDVVLLKISRPMLAA